MSSNAKQTKPGKLTLEQIAAFLDRADKTLIACRNISIDPVRVPLLAEGLLEIGFTRMDAEDAIVWFKWGDWTFKGAKPVCELSDFMPDLAKVNAIRTRLNLPRPAIGRVEMVDGVLTWME